MMLHGTYGLAHPLSPWTGFAVMSAYALVLIGGSPHGDCSAPTPDPVPCVTAGFCCRRRGLPGRPGLRIIRVTPMPG
jgi:hypothetical protein